MKTLPLHERQDLHTWLHQTNEQNPTTSKPRLEFTYNYFSLKFVYQTSTVVVVVAVVVDIFKVCLCFFICALSNRQVSDFDRYLYKKCLKLCFKSPFFITYIKIFRWSHSLICITSVCSTYSLKNFSVHGEPCRNYSPDSLGIFWKTFRKVYEKTVIHQLRSVHIGKNCALCLKYRWSRPRAQSYPIRTSLSVNNIYH